MISVWFLSKAVLAIAVTLASLTFGSNTNAKPTDEPLASNTANFTSIRELIDLAQERNKDTCAVLRERLATKTNDEVEDLLTTYLESSHAICTFISTCKLHKTQENVCGPAVDRIGTCFRSTPAGQYAIVTCPYYLQEVYYDTSKNATRLCQEDGTWAAKTDYSKCTQIKNKTICFDRHILTGNITMEERTQIEEKCIVENYNMNMIMLVGKGLSLVSLVISFILFWTLKSIRCWRNIIHWNLVASFILRIVISFLYRSPAINSYAEREENSVLCRILATLISYAQATNYFWMFVEGLYLHMMVVMAYSYDRINLRVYNAIGWGLPIPLTLLWAILKYILEDHDCWASKEPKMVDYFFQIPIIVLLLVNALILGNVVRILFTKLRSGYASGGGGEASQYTKAVKAAVFLFPLLGVIYILFFISPPDQVGKLAFFYINTFLQSFQGFFVCLIYCFANNEIQRALVKKIHDHWGWQIKCPRCFCRKKDSFKRSGSHSSLSRTHNTIVNLKSREGRGPDDGSKPHQGSPTSSPLLLIERREGEDVVAVAVDGDRSGQTLL